MTMAALHAGVLNASPDACRELHKDPAVTFAGYKIPHPLEYQLLVKVRSAKAYL